VTAVLTAWALVATVVISVMATVMWIDHNTYDRNVTVVEKTLVPLK
jgi:hypothetical protein